jgi:hypothetical protein
MAFGWFGKINKQGAAKAPYKENIIDSSMYESDGLAHKYQFLGKLNPSLIEFTNAQCL